MAEYTNCNQVKIPQVDNSQNPCEIIIPTTCVITKNTEIMLGINEGDTLEEYLENLIKYIKKLNAEVKVLKKDIKILKSQLIEPIP